MLWGNASLTYLVIDNETQWIILILLILRFCMIQWSWHRTVALLRVVEHQGWGKVLMNIIARTLRSLAKTGNSCVEWVTLCSFFFCVWRSVADILYLMPKMHCRSEHDQSYQGKGGCKSYIWNMNINIYDSCTFKGSRVQTRFLHSKPSAILRRLWGGWLQPRNATLSPVWDETFEFEYDWPRDWRPQKVTEVDTRSCLAIHF